MLRHVNCRMSRSTFLLSVKNKGNGRSLKLLTTHIKSPLLWPIWLFTVGDIVFSCGRCGCGRYGCGRYGLWPIWYRPELTRTCMKSLDHNIWCSPVNAYILPILLCNANTWCMTSVSSRRHDAFHQCASATFYGFQYAAHVTNYEERHRTNQAPVTSTTTVRRLRLFGHTARADPSQNHSCAPRAAFNRPPVLNVIFCLQGCRFSVVVTRCT